MAQSLPMRTSRTQREHCNLRREHPPKSIFSPNNNTVPRDFSVAAPPGLEPGVSAPKADVLPLHHGAKAIPYTYCDWRRCARQGAGRPRAASPIWPPNGPVIARSLRYGYRYWIVLLSRCTEHLLVTTGQNYSIPFQIRPNAFLFAHRPNGEGSAYLGRCTGQAQRPRSLGGHRRTMVRRCVHARQGITVTKAIQMR